MILSGVCLVLLSVTYCAAEYPSGNETNPSNKANEGLISNLNVIYNALPKTLDDNTWSLYSNRTDELSRNRKAAVLANFVSNLMITLVDEVNNDDGSTYDEMYSRVYNSCIVVLNSVVIDESQLNTHLASPLVRTIDIIRFAIRQRVQKIQVIYDDESKTDGDIVVNDEVMITICPAYMSVIELHNFLLNNLNAIMPVLDEFRIAYLNRELNEIVAFLTEGRERLKEPLRNILKISTLVTNAKYTCNPPLGFIW